MVSDEHEPLQIFSIKDLHQLVGKRDNLKESIENSNAGLWELDEYLLAELELRMAYVKHPEFVTVSQKDNTSEALYYHEVVQGSYHKEKQIFV